EMPLEPLRLPDLKTHLPLAVLSQFEGVRLFIERAVAAKPDFQVTNENAPAVAGICERVDGLPLAIELAAARVKLFSPQALLNRLNTSMSSVLAGGARDLPGRQQTLRGAIDWSYDLLDEPHRRLFTRFAVFARGANLEQAEAVCGPASELGVHVLTGLDELADQSLVRRMPDFEEPRVLMLQVIREDAMDRLQASGEVDVICARHADAYQALAETAGPHLFGAEQKKWLDRLEIDHDNFRAAFDWALGAGDARRAMGLGAAFWRFWQMRGHLREGRARLEAILAMPGSDKFPAERARALEAAGSVAHWQGDVPAEQAYYDKCLELARAGGDKAAIANALYNASFPRMVSHSDLPGALALAQAALPLYRELGNETGVARSLWSAGNVLHQMRRIEEANVALDESILLFRKLDDRFSLGWANHTRILTAIIQGDTDMAGNLTREALEIFSNAGDLSGIVLLLDDAASLAKIRGLEIRAITIAGAAAAQQQASGATLASVVNVLEGRAWLDIIDTPEEKEAWSRGQAMTVEQAVEYALAG
ncbi:MAG: hypothetical protein KGO22_15180, partial [Gammaproteobacteria bacterium]|nr:hypothetical protein [Gammaproteobacteria bacterium]